MNPAPGGTGQRVRSEMNYYNDNDPKACAWLRGLTAAGELPPGDVDEAGKEAMTTETTPAGAGESSPAPDGSVFEIVDSTIDEQYWTLGMFPTLADALSALDGCTPEDMPGDHDEYEGICRVEVREHKYGWGGTGKCVHAREWTSEYNETADEYEWRIRTPNK